MLTLKKRVQVAGSVTVVRGGVGKDGKLNRQVKKKKQKILKLSVCCVQRKE